MTDYHFLKMKIISKSLDVFFKSQIDRYLPNDNIIGIIFTLHKISPSSSALKFDPNSHLAITPDFLESVVKQVLADGYKLSVVRDFWTDMGVV